MGTALISSATGWNDYFHCSRRFLSGGADTVTSAWQGRGGVGELLLGMEGRLLDAQQGKTNKQTKKTEEYICFWEIGNTKPTRFGFQAAALSEMRVAAVSHSPPCFQGAFGTLVFLTPDLLLCTAG